MWAQQTEGQSSDDLVMSEQITTQAKLDLIHDLSKLGPSHKTEIHTEAKSAWIMSHNKLKWSPRSKSLRDRHYNTDAILNSQNRASTRVGRHELDNATVPAAVKSEPQTKNKKGNQILEIQHGNINVVKSWNDYRNLKAKKLYKKQYKRKKGIWKIEIAALWFHPIRWALQCRQPFHLILYNLNQLSHAKKSMRFPSKTNRQ